MTDKNTALVPEEGRHCLHLYYRIEHGQWQLLSREEQTAAKKIDKQLSLSLGPDVLTPVYSYLSLTEESEYITTDEEHAETLEKEQNLKPDSESFAEAMNSFRDRMKKYRQERVYP